MVPPPDHVVEVGVVPIEGWGWVGTDVPPTTRSTPPPPPPPPPMSRGPRTSPSPEGAPSREGPLQYPFWRSLWGFCSWGFRRTPNYHRGGSTSPASRSGTEDSSTRGGSRVQRVGVPPPPPSKDEESEEGGPEERPTPKRKQHTKTSEGEGRPQSESFRRPRYPRRLLGSGLSPVNLGPFFPNWD